MVNKYQGKSLMQLMILSCWTISIVPRIEETRIWPNNPICKIRGSVKVTGLFRFLITINPYPWGQPSNRTMKRVIDIENTEPAITNKQQDEKKSFNALEYLQKHLKIEGLLKVHYKSLCNFFDKEKYFLEESSIFQLPLFISLFFLQILFEIIQIEFQHINEGNEVIGPTRNYH
jgi:hypothetical protein